MEDLSSLARDSLAVTGQGQGGVTGREVAMSAPAPGSLPSALATSFSRVPDPPEDPRVAAEDTARTTVIHGDETWDASPWTRADGSPWVVSTDEESPGGAPPGGWEQS